MGQWLRAIQVVSGLHRAAAAQSGERGRVGAAHFRSRDGCPGFFAACKG